MKKLHSFKLFVSGRCACDFGLGPVLGAKTNITPDEARAIAKEAYIYGFPVVDNYRVQYAYFVDHDNPEFKEKQRQTLSIS